MSDIEKTVEDQEINRDGVRGDSNDGVYENVPEERPIDSPRVNPVTDADPEGDGLTKGQATADVNGDILGI
jgi:hypothetical protein